MSHSDTSEVEHIAENLQKEVQALSRLQEEERRLQHEIDSDVEKLEKLARTDHEIIVNGEKITIQGDRVTYEEAVALAFPHASPGPNVSYTVTYRMAADISKPEGSLVAGGSVRIKNGTRFNVKATDRS